jgi:molecular chaperone HtpG
MGMNLERILKAAGQSITTTPPILEINPTHPLITKLNVESDGTRFDDWACVLYDQALLSEGGKLDDPAGFVHRLNQLFIDVSTSQSSGTG